MVRRTPGVCNGVFTPCAAGPILLRQYQRGRNSRFARPKGSTIRVQDFFDRSH